MPTTFRVKIVISKHILELKEKLKKLSVFIILKFAGNFVAWTHHLALPNKQQLKMTNYTSQIEITKNKIKDVTDKIKFYKNLGKTNLNKGDVKANIKKLTAHLSSLQEVLHQQEQIAKNISTDDNDIISYSFNKKDPPKKIKRDNSIRFSELLTKELTVSWENVSFLDNKIKIKVSEKRFLTYPLQTARKTYEYIKTILTKRELPPLKIFISSGKISRIFNIDALEQAIKLLEVQTIWNDIYENSTISLRSRLQKIANTLDNSFHDSVLKTKNLSIYMSHLCSLQDEKLPIIPILPFFTKRKKGDEDSFLFTLRKNNEELLLVWESIEINKATYIFNAYYYEYDEVLQNVFDYISTFSKQKRMNLRAGVQFESICLKPNKIIYHTVFSGWRDKLETYL